MAIFHECPVCGEQAIVKPELGNKEQRVFQCGNDHTFKKDVNETLEANDEEIMDHMPEWARKIDELTKNVIYRG